MFHSFIECHRAQSGYTRDVASLIDLGALIIMENLPNIFGPNY